MYEYIKTKTTSVQLGFILKLEHTEGNGVDTLQTDQLITYTNSRPRC